MANRHDLRGHIADTEFGRVLTALKDAAFILENHACVTGDCPHTQDGECSKILAADTTEAFRDLEQIFREEGYLR